MKGFVAYSKADSSAVKRLVVHLKGLEYEGLIETWHDRQIAPGDEWDSKIRAEISAADVIIFCVSADLLATDYVQRVEIPKAIARQEQGKATVIPVIFKNCAWQGHALGKLQAIPAKGGTVQEYIRNGDPDDIWTEVASAVRDAVRARQETDDHNRTVSSAQKAPPATRGQPSGAMPVTLSDFGHASDLEQDDFIQSTFSTVLNYFENSLKNLKNAHPGCEIRLRKLSEDAFEAGVYVNGQRRSFCGVFIHERNGIAYSNNGVGNRNTTNEEIGLVQGERGTRLKWQALMHAWHHASGTDISEMDPWGAAAYFWSIFVQDL